MKTFNRIILGSIASVILTVSGTTRAADPNGYTALYECRAGGPNCNVDVATYTTRTCDQVVTTGTAWASINWSTDTNSDGFIVICLDQGDHTSKGTLTLSGNGTSGAYRVLRAYRSGDNDDEPWNQADGDKAKVSLISVPGNDYWIMHRITLPPKSSGTQTRIALVDSSGDPISHFIINRVLIEGPGLTDVCYAAIGGPGSSYSTTDITIQNSVIRSRGRCAASSPVGIDAELGSNYHIVNNEIYDWTEHTIQMGNNNVPEMPGVVVENNDLYASSAIYDGSGNSSTGWLLSLKESGVSGNPSQIIHNRLWGTRPQFGGTPDSAHAIGMNASATSNNQYNLIQNNIILDSHGGIAGYNNTISNISIIGNLFYGVGPNGTSIYSDTIGFAALSATEVYLNTFINSRIGTPSDNGVFGEWSGKVNLDLRCNLFIDSDRSSTDTPNSSTIMDYNGFYGSPLKTLNGTATNFSKTLATRSVSTAYSLDQIVRTSSTPGTACTTITDTACFLYKVTTAGTTSSGSVVYCNTLDCNQTDGTVVLKAVRGPLSIRRKLRTVTGGEIFVIPYRTRVPSLTEENICPIGVEANAMGSRTNIGIDNAVYPNFPFNLDLTGKGR